jgi:hypothetical protein
MTTSPNTIVTETHEEATEIFVIEEIDVEPVTSMLTMRC